MMRAAKRIITGGRKDEEDSDPSGTDTSESEQQKKPAKKRKTKATPRNAGRAKGSARKTRSQRKGKQFSIESASHNTSSESDTSNDEKDDDSNEGGKNVPFREVSVLEQTKEQPKNVTITAEQFDELLESSFLFESLKGKVEELERKVGKIAADQSAKPSATKKPKAKDLMLAKVQRDRLREYIRNTKYRLLKFFEDNVIKQHGPKYFDEFPGIVGLTHNPDKERYKGDIISVVKKALSDKRSDVAQQILKAYASKFCYLVAIRNKRSMS